LINGSDTVQMYLGEFAPLTPAGARSNVPWIARNDSFVTGEVAHHLSRLSDPPEVVTRYVQFRVHTDAASAASPNEEEQQLIFEDRLSAKRKFETIRDSNVKQTTTLLVGSQKVNLLVEHLVADLFDLEAFHATDALTPAPFYLAYRSVDAGAESAFGGHESPPGFTGKHEPGVYVMGNDGSWTCHPWLEDRLDAGIAVITHDEKQETLEIALFGYSGNATRVIGEYFLKNPQEFWPLPATRGRRKVGVFVCVISFPGTHEPGSAETCKIIPLDSGVIER
jgi:hypothetical protein